MSEQAQGTEKVAAPAGDLPPDILDTNPFADEAYLRREIERIGSVFKGIAKDADEVHEVWKRYQKRRGDTACVQLSLGIDTLRMLDVIHQQLIERGDDGITGLVILFHIALLEQVEQGQYLSFTDWLLGRLKDAEPPLPTGTTVAAIKEYMLSREQEYESENGAAKAVIRALRQGLSSEDKRRLILGFRFRDPSPPSSATEMKDLGCVHVHCRELKAAGKYVDPGCLSCPPPRDADLDHYLGLLARRLYTMRSVLVHRAMWVWFARIPLIVDGLAVSSGTMVDGYFDRDNRLVTYEVTLLVDDLVAILRRCIWNRLAQQPGE